MPDLINEDEHDENLEETPEEKTSRPDNRFKDLSEKVKTTAEERDKANAEKEAAERDVQFYKGFTPLTSKYQGAAEYQDKILEKVRAGYDLEDATISVMAKAGKLTNAPAQRESPAGGSASTAMKNEGEKPLHEMTRDEKHAALEQIEAESGAISQILRRGL